MARAKKFLSAALSGRWDKSYQGLNHVQQKEVDRVVMAVLKQEATGGMRIKPIQPEKVYYEARINDGDRLVFRTDAGTVWFVDIVKQDDIGRYGKRVDSLA